MIRGTITPEQTIFEAIGSKVNTTLVAVLGAKE
jgi:hypothetical protein